MRCLLGLVLASSLPLLPGCIIGPDAAVAANGVVVAAPAAPGWVNVLGPFQAGVALARPVSLTDLESNLVTASAVWVDVDGAVAELAAEDVGLYAWDASRGSVPIAAEAPVSLHAIVDGEEGSVTVLAPPTANLWGLPTAHPPGTDLVIPVADLALDLAYLTVVDAGGQIVWDDRPEDAGDVVWDLEDADGVDAVVVPGAVLRAAAGYSVAITGVRSADDADYTNLSRLFSNFGVGSVGYGMVVTAP